MKNPHLLQKLITMKIEPDGARLSFTNRLASENGWTSAYAARVNSEYRRLLYLAATLDHPVTPSDEVDQAWHLHLAYSRHYWDILCGEILGQALHHGPTAGGAVEDNRYRDQYQRTLDAYHRAFGYPPPADIWPDAKRRFGVRYRRIATGRHWMVPKQAGYAILPLLTLAACTQGEWVVAGFFGIGLLIAGGLAILLQARTDPAHKKKDDGGCAVTTGGCGSSDNCNDSGASGCGGGGCGGGCGS